MNDPRERPPLEELTTPCRPSKRSRNRSRRRRSCAPLGLRRGRSIRRSAGSCGISISGCWRFRGLRRNDGRRCLLDVASGMLRNRYRPSYSRRGPDTSRA